MAQYPPKWSWYRSAPGFRSRNRQFSFRPSAPLPCESFSLHAIPSLIRAMRTPYARTTLPPKIVMRHARLTGTQCTVWTTSARLFNATRTQIWNLGRRMPPLRDTASTNVKTLIEYFPLQRNGGSMMARIITSGSRSLRQRQFPVESSITSISRLGEIQNLHSRIGIMMWGDSRPNSLYGRLCLRLTLYAKAIEKTIHSTSGQLSTNSKGRS